MADTTTLTIRVPFVDRLHIRDVLVARAAEADDEGFHDNEWRRLVGDSPATPWFRHPDGAENYVSDMFVLCRTTPELFGGVPIEGHILKRDPEDRTFNAFIGISLGAAYHPPLVGQIFDYRDVFDANRNSSTTNYSVAVLTRIGTAAQRACNSALG